MLLHLGGTNTATLITTVVVIFFLMFAISFAFGKIPEGGHRFGREWMMAWFKASLPRFIISGVFSGLLLAGTLLAGDNQKTATAASCNQAVPPLTGVSLTDARILGAIDGTQRIAEAARQGDLAKVQALFFSGDAHNVMHDIDAPLRAKDAKLGKDLCLAVIVVENQMVTSLDAEVIARESDQIAAYLQQARGVLNLPAQGTPGPVVTGSGYCLQPVGAVTAQTLSKSRLDSAASSLRGMADAAEAGRDDEALTLFGGETHNLTHDIDGPLREVNEQLAIKLCGEVVAIETAIAANSDLDATVAENARAAADDIEEAGRVLGITQ